jgi:hypothetical protein
LRLSLGHPLPLSPFCLAQLADRECVASSGGEVC